MSWTINENSKTSTTEYFNATHTNIPADHGLIVDSAFKNVAGYVSGTINYVLSPPPSGWPPNSTLEISIIGRIETLSFSVTPSPIPPITASDLNSTFSIEWDIPLEEVSLRINNATPTPTGFDISIENICMQTESQGGGVGHQAGIILGPLAQPALPFTTLQYNDSGTFASTSQGPPPFIIIVSYDKAANASTGQLKLSNGSVSAPMLAFSDGSHPNGTYDTGIYRVNNDAVGFSCGNSAIVGVYGTALVPFIKGLNVGQTANICGIQRLSRIAANSWEDGWMGNSAQLVFTGSDFTNYNTAAGRPELFAVASARSAGGTGFVMDQAAGVNNNEITAVKLLPKGFQVSNEAVTVATADQSPTIMVWE